MNRSALNSAILGSGSRLPLSFAAAYQALYLIAVMTAGVIRRGVVNQSLNLSGTPTARVKRFFKAAEAMSLKYSAECHAWVKVYGKIVQNFALGYETVARRVAYMKVTSVMSLVPTVRSHFVRSAKAVQQFALESLIEIRTAILAAINGSVGLRGVLTAYDIPTASAGVDRTAYVTWFTRQIVVPGSAFSGDRKAVLDSAGTRPPETPGTPGTGTDFGARLDDLRDVVSIDPSAGEVLVFDGVEWVPAKIDGGTFE